MNAYIHLFCISYSEHTGLTLADIHAIPNACVHVLYMNVDNMVLWQFLMFNILYDSSHFSAVSVIFEP